MISFTVTLLDGNRKTLTFSANENKIQRIGFRIEIVRRETSRKMNDDKAAEETKNLFAGFKVLATKVNDDN